MNRFVVRCVVATVIAWSSPARADTSPSTSGGNQSDSAGGNGGAEWAPPSPSPENGIFQKWLGTWTCEGTAEGPSGTKAKYDVTWKWSKILGSQWYSAVYTRPRQGKVVAFEANITAGYNRAEKNYLFTSFDGFGSWVRLSSLDGATFTGDGTIHGTKAPVKITFANEGGGQAKHAKDHITVKLEVGGPAIIELCRK